jgi:hypothetical protein
MAGVFWYLQREKNSVQLRHNTRKSGFACAIRHGIMISTAWLTFFRTYIALHEQQLFERFGDLTMERRLHTRHRARTAVYVSVPGRPGKLCRARNLSANGVFIETENLGLKKGATVHLAFAINLGVVTKIHRRTAIVAHISRGGTGLMMESLTGTR